VPAETIDMMVPLRVSGRVHGALVFTAAHPAVLRERHAEPAMRLADIIALHLEVFYRSALLLPPTFQDAGAVLACEIRSDGRELPSRAGHRLGADDSDGGGDCPRAGNRMAQGAVRRVVGARACRLEMDPVALQVRSPGVV
jgi:hypothetical protein